MNWKDSYNDIKSELRILQLHEIEVRRRVEIAHKVLFSGEVKSSGDYCHIPLDMGIEKYNAAVVELEAIQVEVDRVQQVVNGMEAEMVKFTGLANVIMYKRVAEGKTYKQIGSELGYSEAYLRLYMHRNDNKVITQSTNAS